MGPATVEVDVSVVGAEAIKALRGQLVTFHKAILTVADTTELSDTQKVAMMREMVDDALDGLE